MRIVIAITSLLILPVLQVGAADPPPSIGMHGSGAASFPHDSGSWDESLYEEQEFAQRFNKLVFALQSFSKTYNSGHVVDVKRVKAIKKAWHELEKSGWFKPEQGKVKGQKENNNNGNSYEQHRP